VLDYETLPDHFPGFAVNEYEATRRPVFREGVWAKKRELLSSMAGHCGARLEKYNGNVCVRAFTDPYIEIDGDLVDVGGDQGITLNITHSLINAAGFPTGSAPTADTTYYAYVGNNRSGHGVGFSGQNEMSGLPVLRLSATAPSVVYASTLGNGSSLVNNHFQRQIGPKYLGQTDSARCWRFVGLVRITGGDVPDTETQRFVVSYHNRLRKHLFRCPAYNNNNAVTTWTTVSTSWAEWNGGTGSRIEFLSFGDEAVSYWATVQAYVGTSAKHIGIGEDTTSVAAISAGEDPAGGVRTSWGLRNVYTPSIGYHFLAALIVSTGGNTLTVEADFLRFGGGTDPKTSCFGAEIAG
jgi:hypothetical protein